MVYTAYSSFHILRYLPHLHPSLLVDWIDVEHPADVKPLHGLKVILPKAHGPLL
ncbi:hypothetical protein SERLA73DRAFT_191234 [Serpula lacrymans var. lacrymans S7.3]|uniref:Uncharacterized protein n=1 Tax=Serpula lacrymans var. lacrymans (strain S7.3) TaxID=936435 RepID=F8QH52_SERL3|nr:hypothetical protein SERLA73DRAFT_191234 [Serpula lacrymans var. lacrymans S7.3]